MAAQGQQHGIYNIMANIAANRKWRQGGEKNMHYMQFRKIGDRSSPEAKLAEQKIGIKQQMSAF